MAKQVTVIDIVNLQQALCEEHVAQLRMRSAIQEAITYLVHGSQDDALKTLNTALGNSQDRTPRTERKAYARLEDSEPV